MEGFMCEDNIQFRGFGEFWEMALFVNLPHRAAANLDTSANCLTCQDPACNTSFLYHFSLSQPPQTTLKSCDL
jgi:hypothetical protein